MANFCSLLSSIGKEGKEQDKKQRIDNLPHMVRQKKLAIDTGKKAEAIKIERQKISPVI
ncbi:TPA: hypothetical protein OFX27_004253 [Escherichia coli]|nr:hypothetical protein [Escherichia coli]